MPLKKQLSDERIVMLMDIITNAPHPDLVLKATAILMLDRMRSEDVAQELGWSASHLRRLKWHFDKKGTIMIEDKRHKGGNRKLSIEEERKILDNLQGSSGERVSFADLRKALKNDGVKLDDSSIRRMLYRNKWQSAGRGYYKKN